ncbi:MAG: TniB family NTP-binding protein [Roseiarcus sp.]
MRSYDEALDRLDELFLFSKRARMPNLLIFGPSGMGKTMIVEKALVHCRRL